VRVFAYLCAFLRVFTKLCCECALRVYVFVPKQHVRVCVCASHCKFWCSSFVGEYKVDLYLMMHVLACVCARNSAGHVVRISEMIFARTWKLMEHDTTFVGLDTYNAETKHAAFARVPKPLHLLNITRETELCFTRTSCALKRIHTRVYLDASRFSACSRTLTVSMG